MPFTPLTEPPADAATSPRWYLVRDAELLEGPDGGPCWPAPPPDLEDAADTPPIFLGADDGAPCWARGVSGDPGDAGGATWRKLLTLGSELDADAWRVAGRAVQLVEWWRTHRFCGRCSTPTVPVAGERSLHCPACGLHAYPRLAPAVIVLVRRGNEALLARNARFRGRMFSTLAGFVEPGETLEEAVHREVGEEVGVRLGDVRYAGSQPWPFPHSLMVGFTAEWAGGEPVADGVEIAEAGWFTAGALPELPPPQSIARRLIDGWLEGLDDGIGGAARR